MSTKREKIDETQLKAILSSELQTALGVDGGQLSTDRKRLLEYYSGLPFGNEVEGRSQVVTRQVLETVESILPALVRLFVQNEKVVEFEPYRPSEERAAYQATQYVNWILFHDGNNFFSILMDWLKDCLIQRVGYIRVFWNDEDIHTTSTFTGLNDQEYDIITQAEDVEIIEESTYPNPDPQLQWFTEDSPQPQVPTLHDIRIRVTQREGRVRIENLAPESVRVSRFAPSSVLDGNHFVSICRSTRVSNLRELGYPEDLIEEAMGSSADDFNTERVSRFFADDAMFSDDRTDTAMREVWLEESFIKIDYDGDGIAELRRIVSANNASTIFENEPIDEIPVISVCPIPLPHKHVGLGVADLVTDLQEINSTLVRQVLDNIYLSNSPRILVDEMSLSENSVDDLLNVRPGGIVRVNNIQGLTPLQVPFVAGNSLPILEWLENAAEMRTGISKHNLGLSPDDLNRHTATGISLLQQAASQRVELIARVIAETGVRVLGSRILSLILRHQQKARVIRLTGEWVEMDVRDWRSNMDVSCAVGLGTGNRDATLTHLTQILQVQQQIVGLQGGVNGPLVTAPNVYAVLNKLVANAGFGKDQFFSDPAKMPPQQPQPDPAMMKAQVEVEATKAKTQAQMAAEHQKTQNDLTLETQKAAHQMQLEAIKNQHQIDLAKQREQAKAEIMLLNQQNQMSQPRKQMTKVTKHDEHGRILEFTKEDI